MSSSSNNPWRVCVDTGGTFSDCIATSPEGEVRRAKVLSSSALRARVLEALSPTRIRIEESWGAPDGLVDGWTIGKLAGGGARVGVLRHGRDAASTVLELASPLVLGPGEAVELVSPEESPVLAARLVTQTPAGRALPPIVFRLATTRGTNALLERRAGPVAFFVTRGFADLLAIGTQQRPDIFALDIEKPRPLYDAVVEVEERLSVDGSVLRPLDLGALERALPALRERGISSAAVALMHSWRNPAHERAVAGVLAAHGFAHVSCSHEMGAAIKLLPRAQTAVVDAYLAPVIRGYLGNVASALGAGSTLHAMSSSGGLVSGEEFRAKDSLLSGPAGGVVGAAHAARASGFSRIISFDMGGTSTDVARYDGDHQYVFEHKVGDAQIVAPAVAVESVAAGGGSVCWFDAVDGSLKVGPRSAGASPGPACYGAGGPLTITDCNLLLGRLDASHFGIPIVREAAEARARELAAEVGSARGGAPEILPLLEGLVELADERMAQAIRSISIAKGFDPADHALVAFGGAGGQHASSVARRLGMTKVLIPRDVGLLSAKGLGHAGIERFAHRQVLLELNEAYPKLAGTLAELEAEARAAVAREGVAGGVIQIRRRLAHLRLSGQDTAIAVELSSGEPARREIEAEFAKRYRLLYGLRPAERAIEVESVLVIASSREREGSEAVGEASRVGAAEALRVARSVFHGRVADATVYSRDRLAPGQTCEGPALILESHGTTVVPPGWRVQVDGAGALVLTCEGGRVAVSGSGAVRSELLISRIMAIAAEMGETLRATALSTNVKERLDFSCAILDAAGQLVINAPHIPVHLGALGLSVRQVCAAIEMGEGDVVVTNHPAFGGSHLPDITVVTPVHHAHRLIAYVACRAHHAEIGGTRPGSMPPLATTLAEEGVVIPPMYLVRAGESRLEAFRRRLTGAPHPTRQPEDNVADIQAQIAANHRGACALAALAGEFGAETLAGAMALLTDMAHLGASAALERFAGKKLVAEEELDDGSRIRVTVEVFRGGACRVDFEGSSGTHPRNFNAPLGVVRSALMYVLRLLIDEPLPLNEGILRGVDLRIPEGLLNPRFDADPTKCPAVAAGNCETSQRVVDTLLKAFGLAACSQGTMNNLIFGNARFGYYETICGGSGATQRGPGASAVHTHMTNTRITDPEVLEHRYPVRLERFAVRTGSGGRGAHNGGDGAIREYTFLEPVSVSLLTQHRTTLPYGTAGGGEGRPGVQTLVLPGAEGRELGPVESLDLPAGARLSIATPGGGGWGPPR